MLTLTNLLRLPAFSGADVLSFNNPDNRKIRGITLMDSFAVSPDQANQLILTGQAVIERLCAEEPDALRAFLAGNAAALCISVQKDGVLPDLFLNALPDSRFPVLVNGPEVAFDQMINAVTFEIFRQEGYSQELSFEENFLQELIASTQDRETYVRRGAMLGLRKDEILVAALIQPDLADSAQKICRYCDAHFSRYGYYLTKNDRILAALRLTLANSGKMYAVGAASKMLEELKEAFPNVQFRIGIGRSYDALADFTKSFSDACSALSYSMIMRSNREISHFDDLGIYRILFDYSNRRELFALYQDIIGTIREYDLKNDTEYLKTIRTYFDENYSVNNTSKRLYTHYNTVIHRFQKIKALFDIDMFNESERINLYVCLVAADSQNLWNTY